MRSVNQEAQRQNKRQGQGGFSLIGTISIVVLLALAMTALLTLSVISTRSQSTHHVNAIAEENAKIALMEALSTLQSSAGPDTRITAPADALQGAPSTAPRQLTGVWRSWEGLDHNAEGEPVAPDYFLKQETYDPTASSNGRFLRWLVSSDQGAPANMPPSLEASENTVPLLSSGTSNIADHEVHVVPTQINKLNRGEYAWWVQGENTKALILPEDFDPEVSDISTLSQRLASQPKANTETFGISNTHDLGKLVSLDSLEFIHPSFREHYHDLTTYASGLMTNTANGGWKRDLSLFAEKWTGPERVSWGRALPQEGFSTFTIAPGLTNKSTTGLDSASQGYLYPWVRDQNVSMTWSALADFASLYKKLKVQDGTPYYEMNPTLSEDSFSIVEPLFSRIQFTLGFGSERIGADLFSPLIGIQPVITYHNPYNISIDASKFTHEILLLDASTWPFNLSFEIGDTLHDVINMQLLLGSVDRTKHRLRIDTELDSSHSLLWKPGESKVFGNTNISGVVHGRGLVQLNSGYTTNAAYFTILDGDALSDYTSGASYPGNTPIKATWHPITSSDEVVTQTINFVDRKTVLPNRQVSTRFRSSSILEKLALPEDVFNDDKTLADLEGDYSPFLTFSLQLRNVLESHTATKGYINNKLIIPHNLSGANFRDDSIEDNSYDWYIRAVSGATDPNLPSFITGVSTQGDIGGLVGTSHNAYRGSTRWVTHELPVRPLLSLLELQHFDPAFNNFDAPRMSHAIGNGHATPHIAPAAVKVPETKGCDHSYIANHLLFDDWFLSSLAPKIHAYSHESTIDDTLMNFLTGQAPLLNTAYFPSKRMSVVEAQQEVERMKESSTSWERMASLIEVKGMFNINSTSVDAWKALLKSQYQGVVPAQTISPHTHQLSVARGPQLSYPVSRFTLTGDPLSAGNASQSLSEVMNFSNEQIDSLAEEIVKQIKLRGPFLSLSEFLNRQLSSDQDLALASAVDTALMNLADLTGENLRYNPYHQLLASFSPMVSENGVPKYLSRQFSDTEELYPFTRASEGHVAYGTPGWSRQADVLRPIASILNARDDTFKIRAYGNVKDKEGAVLSEKWCEATVVRTADYVDSSNAASEHENLSELNLKLGRKFKIVSFRWLNKNEI